MTEFDDRCFDSADCPTDTRYTGIDTLETAYKGESTTEYDRGDDA